MKMSQREIILIDFHCRHQYGYYRILLFYFWFFQIIIIIIIQLYIEMSVENQ